MEEVTSRIEHTQRLFKCALCLILLAGGNLHAQQYLGQYIGQWDELQTSPLDDITWAMPSRTLVGGALQRLLFRGRSGHFRSMQLTPVVMVADHETPKQFRSEAAGLLLSEGDGIGINQNGEFYLSFDVRPAIYRFHVTFSTLTGSRLSYLLVLNVEQNTASLQRYVKNTHNLGLERFLTYQEILERADYEAYTQTEGMEELLESIYRSRRKNFIYFGTGAALLSFSQNIPDINVRSSTTTTHLPLLALGFDYNFGRDFYIIGELRHQPGQDPEILPFARVGEETLSWSSQSLHGHYTLSNWNRRFDIIAGLSRTRYPFYQRDTRRTLLLDKETVMTGVFGLKGRWILSSKTQLQVQALIRPILMTQSESELRDQQFYGAGFSLLRNLGRNWRITLEGSFDKYSLTRTVSDPVDVAFYESRLSLVQTSLMARWGRTF
jgi:hypothetical protein